MIIIKLYAMTQMRPNIGHAVGVVRGFVSILRKKHYLCILEKLFKECTLGNIGDHERVYRHMYG